MKNLKQENTSFCLSKSDKVNHNMTCSTVPVSHYELLFCAHISTWFQFVSPHWELQGATCQFLVIKLPDGRISCKFLLSRPAMCWWNTINGCYLNINIPTNYRQYNFIKSYGHRPIGGKHRIVHCWLQGHFPVEIWLKNWKLPLITKWKSKTVFREFFSIKKFPHFILLFGRPPINDQKAVAGAGVFI